MNRIIYIIIIIGILLLIACSERKDHVKSLSRAETVMNKDADSALKILDSLSEYEADFSRHFKMQCQLHRMNAYNKLDTIFHTTKEGQELVDYFDNHGTPNEQMLAYYLLGRSYYDTHEVPMALNCFLLATEKADTADTNCNYRQLSRIYGQINSLFYQQNLMRQCIEYSLLEEKYAWRAKDTLNALKSIGDRIGVYRPSIRGFGYFRFQKSYRPIG